MGQFDYYVAGSYGLWPTLAPDGQAPLAYSLCKYAISANHPVFSDDMYTDDDRRIREHPLVGEYSARAFLAVPLKGGDDEPVGAITVLDTAARSWTAGDLLKMSDIAELVGPVVTEPSDAPLPITSLDTAGLLHSMQEAFVAINYDSVVVGFNRAAQELLGWRPDQVHGQRIEKTLCPDYDEQIISRLLLQLRFAPSQVRMRQQLRLRHSDGHVVVGLASFSMVHGSAGSLLCAFITRPEDSIP
ncbi:PAS domain S-box protein [Actinoplanes xinjiangensis]|uniref:PAS domain S-box protein n=1 Tax=Actinoplanes xinjiangensis TaxID=512350 RepID=UPI003429B458